MDEKALFSFLLNLDMDVFTALIDAIKKFKPDIKGDELQNLVEELMDPIRLEMKLFLFEQGLLEKWLKESFNLNDDAVKQIVERIAKLYDEMLKKEGLETLYPPKKHE